MQNKQEKIISRISEILKVPKTQMNSEVLLTDLVQESFLLIEMIIELQEEFQFRLNQEDLVEVTTLGHLLQVIEKKML